MSLLLSGLSKTSKMQHSLLRIDATYVLSLLSYFAHNLYTDFNHKPYGANSDLTQPYNF